MRRRGRRAGAKPTSPPGPPHDLEIRTKKIDIDIINKVEVSTREK